MGQTLLKEVPKLKEWPHFSGEGEYDHMEFIRGIDMIKEDFELPDRLVTARFNTLFTKSAHRWYIKLRQAHGHQSWTWWKTQIINKWANDAWRFKVETAFESEKFNADKDKALPWKILRHCGGDLEDAVKSRTTEQSSAEDIINILGEVTTRTKIGSSRLEKFKSEQLKEAEIRLHLSDKQENELLALLYDHKEAFASDKEPLGEIIGHEVDITFNIKRPYPPLFRRPAYPANPKSREALEMHIPEPLNLGVIRKVGHNEEVEIPTPIIVAWHNGKSRMVGDFRALNTYTVPDRYPIPKIQISLTQISQEVYLSIMDGLKGLHQNLVTPRARKYLRIIVHCGVYEYSRMPFGIKNAPSHFQRMMNKIFPEELSEGWLIIYIDEIIVYSKTWEEHMWRLSRILTKFQPVNMKISLKEFLFWL
ncbi:hypothetical protein O181_061589 [Austropuccinia psidii MF-1]|uniref:Reverse transcriptase domain-containing protein n=1 Tax=Austropuccinia psidii MF-1 TaxID=1389203 RepID=A0A9Q3I0Q1_9BASI|nr:hypothetical protein [Austropuccinia psidii MF-1]